MMLGRHPASLRWDSAVGGLWVQPSRALLNLNGPRSSLAGTLQNVLNALQSGRPRLGGLACSPGGWRASSSLVKPLGGRQR